MFRKLRRSLQVEPCPLLCQLHRTRRACSSATQPEQLPALLLSELRDVRGVVFAVPGIEEKHPIERFYTMVGVPECAGELFRLHRTEQSHPPFMQWFEQQKRAINWRMRRVLEFRPGTFLVRLDGWV